jgi:thiamine biosynthesis lipoprotein
MVKISIVFLLILTLCGCGNAGDVGNADALPPQQTAADSADAPQSAVFFAMDTVMDIQAYGPRASEGIQDAETEIMRLETLFSHTLEGSDVSRINAADTAVTEVSEATAQLLDRALALGEKTGGALDVTIYPLVEAYGFPSYEYAVLTEAERRRLLERVDYRDVTVEPDACTVAFAREGMALSLGAVAKGYTSQAISDLLRGYGITSALISLGGNVQAVGAKPDGSAWRVAVQNPFDETGYAGVLSIEDCAVITSGGYQRYFDVEENGETVRYHHIIDPDSGLPARSGLSSVTVVTSDGFLGDALSTVLFVMGLDKAVEFWRREAGFDAVFITDAGEVYVTEGLSGRYQPEEEYAAKYPAVQVVAAQ